MAGKPQVPLVWSRITNRRRIRCSFLLPLVLLAGCGAPHLRATRTLWRNIEIQNTDEHSFVVKRVIANNSPDNSDCNNYPNAALAPGESYPIAFLLCGTINRLDVETDRGTSTVDFNADGAQ